MPDLTPAPVSSRIIIRGPLLPSLSSGLSLPDASLSASAQSFPELDSPPPRPVEPSPSLIASLPASAKPFSTLDSAASYPVEIISTTLAPPPSFLGASAPPQLSLPSMSSRTKLVTSFSSLSSRGSLVVSQPLTTDSAPTNLGNVFYGCTRLAIQIYCYPFLYVRSLRLLGLSACIFPAQISLFPYLLVFPVSFSVSFPIFYCLFPYIFFSA